MLSSRLNSSSKLSTSFDTISSLHGSQLISYHINTNNNKIFFNEKQPRNTKFDQTIDRAVEYFEQILGQCDTSSNTSLIKNIDQQEHIKSKFEAKKRDCEHFLRSIKQGEQKLNCRKWCEEQNQRISKYKDPMNDNDGPSRVHGFTFYCRKALLQKPDGITYICSRKRFD